ncbi:MAG: hypothetical protein VX347_01770 [Bacteroidota bacterium]|nr:hypothetical protein [Bacteroidota bacterium]
MKNILIILSFIFLSTACKKGEDNNEFVFEINLIDVTPTSVEEFIDIVFIEVGYKHSSASVGLFHPDSLSVEVQDSRLNSPDYYFLSPLSPPNNSMVNIQGTLILEVGSPFLLGLGNTETLTYTIRIIDRENNSSNFITTPQITVYR